MLCKAWRQFGFWRNQFCVLPPQLKQVFWETVQEVGGASALVMDGWQFLRSFCLRPARRGAVMKERGELLMITAVRIYIAASSALTHTHPGPNHLFRVINISWGFVGRKHRDWILCFMQNTCESRFPAGSRCVCCHGRRWPPRSDAGSLVVALEWACPLTKAS